MKKSFTAKLYILTKQLVLQAVFLAAFCAMALARNYPGQVLDREITLRLSNVLLETALREIESAAKVKFAYSLDQLNVKDPVSIDANKRALRDVLNDLLTPLHISYKVHEKESSITLRKQNENRNRDQSQSEQANNAPALPWVIKGSVTDAADNQPLAGVNIIAKGTTTGTTTDADGKYSIKANENDVLVFSFIGYASYEMQISRDSVVNVELQQDVRRLTEVVINAGYWLVKEKEQTGSIAKVSAEEFGKQPVNNPLQALQGKMPGVYIQQLSGIPGGSFNIQIRGQNSLRNNSSNNGNRPLYIIDGVPFTADPLGTPNSAAIIDGGNPLNNINPSDIESVEILKDADATAIYGSRGANGVVLITTKKGKTGKAQFSLNVYQGAGNVARKMNLLNTQQYLEMRNEAFANDNVAPGTYRPDYDILRWDPKRYTDWQKILAGGTANITNAQLSVSGGSANTQFYIGGGYLRESAVFPGDFADQKASLNFKINHVSADSRLKIDFSAYYLVDNNKLPRIDLTPKSLTLSPNAPGLYNPDGTLNWENSTWSNPLAFLRQEFSARTTNLVNNTIVSYRIIDGLTARVNLGYTEIQFNEFTSQPKSSFDPSRTIASSSTFAEKSTNTWISEPQLEYKTKTGLGALTALVGGTFQASNSEGQAISATGFTSDALLHNIQAASSLAVTSSSVVQYRYSAVFGRLNYNWNGKYILNLTGRRDGSSRFGPGRQFANFGAAGAAWIFSQEEFMRLPFLSFGKLRMSYGTTGSDQIGNYGYLDLWGTTSYSYGGTTGLYPQNLANPDYGWEINKKLEAGLELG
ncbi:MAG TPA: SusC/RagA family TonB-linked outer membrane protein, partial [Cyclobacteriaceae bacterium]|nr:SusC/RagA family TonB-linked outer membrane protein [Cyclobacteriaceae bacterium]